MTLFYAFALCTIYFSIYISFYFNLCSFEHLSFMSFLFCSLELSFSLWIYLITNLNNKKNLRLLGLFGYYPWHFGDINFLDLGLGTLTYVGDLVTSIVILSGVIGVYSKTLGFFVCFVCRLFWLHALSVIRNSSVYSR